MLKEIQPNAAIQKIIAPEWEGGAVQKPTPAGPKVNANSAKEEEKQMQEGLGRGRGECVRVGEDAEQLAQRAGRSSAALVPHRCGPAGGAGTDTVLLA